MFFITLFILIIIAWTSFHSIKNRRKYHLFSKIPAPKKLPLLHNSLELIGKSPVDLFNWLELNGKKYGSVYHFTVSPWDIGSAVISDVKIVEALLTSQTLLDKTIDYDLIVPWIGTGLLISTGKKWFQRRKLLTPGFHFQILEKFVDVMDDQAKVFIQQLSKHEGKIVDIFPLVNLYALDTICGKFLHLNISIFSISFFKKI